MQKATVVSGQNLFDIALQLTGSASAAFWIALENGLSITDEITPGMELTYSGDVVVPDVLGYYQQNRIQPATAFGGDDIVLGGIGYWAIENDFVVS